MSNVVNLEPGTISPAAVLKDSLDHVGDKELVIVISVNSEGKVSAGWSRTTTRNLAHALMVGSAIVQNEGVLDSVFETP